MASEYIYHWNRIFGALALLAVLLGAVGYGVARLFFSESEVPGLAEPTSSPTTSPVIAEPAEPRSAGPAPTPEKFPAVVGSPAGDLAAGPGLESKPEQAFRSESEGVDNPIQAPLDPSESNPPASVAQDFRRLPQQARVAESVAHDLEPGGPEPGAPALEDPVSDPAEMAREPVLRPIAAVPNSDPGPSPTPAGPLPAAAPVPDRYTAPDRLGGQPQASAEQQSPAQPASHPVLEAEGTTLFSPSVQRFSLAQGIENREPVAGLQAVTFDENGLAVAYAFSEVQGLMGSTLYYHWLHEGEELAAVRIRVADQRWRSHSSKYIEQEKTGAWTVQLRDAKGELLAQADFTLRPRNFGGSRR
jgi:hypothetical protein